MISARSPALLAVAFVTPGILPSLVSLMRQSCKEFLCCQGSDSVIFLYFPIFAIFFTGLMEKIQMVDLISQYQHIQDEVDKAVLDVIRSSAYINGPEVKAFAAELSQYLNVKEVIPC